jgi:ABC-type multidrug transport system permease subunit
MKALIALTISALRLHLRTRPALFTTVVMPFVVYFIYMAIFASGQPVRVLAFLGPVLILMSTTNGIYGLGGDLLIMRESGTLAAYNLAPVSASQVLLSRIAVDFCMTLAVGAIEILISVSLFHAPLHADALDLIVIAMLAAATLGSLGAIVVSVTNSFFEANMYSQVIFLVLLILSGLTVPVQHLPHAAQYVSHLLPTTMLVTSLNGILMAGAHFYAYWREIFTLLGFIATALTLSAVLFRWDKEQQASRREKVLACVALLPMILSAVIVRLISTGSVPL